MTMAPIGMILIVFPAGWAYPSSLAKQPLDLATHPRQLGALRHAAAVCFKRK